MCSVHKLDKFFFFFQAEDGIRYLVRSRGLGDVYKRQVKRVCREVHELTHSRNVLLPVETVVERVNRLLKGCLLYTSDAADDLLCVDLGGRRNIKKKTNTHNKSVAMSALSHRREQSDNTAHRTVT